MLTRAMFLSAGWFFISLLGTLIFGARLRKGHWILSILWLAFVIAAGDAWAYLTFGIPSEMQTVSLIVFTLGFVFILMLRNWNAFGQVLWTMTVSTTILFLAYSFSVTAFTPLNAISFLLAVIFFFVEAAALLLALTHTFESLDVVTRIRWKRRVRQIHPNSAYIPKVSLHVPAYNEPPDVVQRTLQSLARLDYPNFEVLVIDNNTPDEKVWRSLKRICDEMGPRFRYLHLDNWPGYKSGALNFGLTHTAPDAEIIGTIDSDYEIYPNFLKELVPAFANPDIAFVQTPQDYREVGHDIYSEATYYGYEYFFNVSMPSRNERNAIIFAGTMGLIRKSVLQEIGGWDEWCITEDAEASLRILKRGYKSVFVNKSFGRGLMPFNFEGLKKQRFRWCFGGIQILRKHWEALMPWGGWVDPGNRLTLAQRYYYLAGGLQWYTDLFNLLFAIFLVLGALFVVFDARFVIRPLTGPLLIMPAVFLFLHMWRFMWVLRTRLRLTWKIALATMFNFFSLGWAVTLASIQGLIQKKAAFLRTPKVRSESKFWQAVGVTRWETLIGLTCFTAGMAGFITRPDIKTFFLAVLLTWQASLYLAAPFYSLKSVSAPPPVRMRPVPAYGQPVLESWVGSAALIAILLLVVVGVAAQFIPIPQGVLEYTRFQPPEVPVERLVGLENVPVEERDNTPTPTEALPTEAETPLPTPTLEPSPTFQPTSTQPVPTPSPTTQPTATSLPTSTPTPTATETPETLPGTGNEPTPTETPLVEIPLP